MTIKEIKTRYPEADLSSSRGVKEMRREAFSPLFNNLFENKIVYRERFVGIVKVEDLIMTADAAKGKAIPYLLLEGQSRADQYFFNRSWEFGSDWSVLRVCGSNALCTYSGWKIWPEAAFVKRVEELLLNKKFEEAVRLLQ